MLVTGFHYADQRCAIRFTAAGLLIEAQGNREAIFLT
jgi:hypothetical protein